VKAFLLGRTPTFASLALLAAPLDARPSVHLAMVPVAMFLVTGSMQLRADANRFF